MRAGRRDQPLILGWVFPVAWGRGVVAGFFPIARLSDSPTDRSKGRTELWISQSEAKLLREVNFDVRIGLDPPKPIENCEKPNFSSENSGKKFSSIFLVKKSIFANRPKRVLPKFGGDRTEVRGVTGRSKFVVAVRPRREAWSVNSYIVNVVLFHSGARVLPQAWVQA